MLRGQDRHLGRKGAPLGRLGSGILAVKVGLRAPRRQGSPTGRTVGPFSPSLGGCYSQHVAAETG